MIVTLNQISSGFFTYFKIWWIPIVSYLIPALLFVGMMFIKRDFMIYVFFTFFYLNILGNVLSAVYQISIGKWYFVIPQIFISGYLLLHISLFFAFATPDFYGAHKTIPNDIDISEPFNTPPPDKPPLDITPAKADMASYHLAVNVGKQSGIYHYYTDYQPTELGNFYIKAFEVSLEDRLSDETIKNQSTIPVEDLEPKIYSGEFWIYEGSWGDKYGARIELWFEPLDGSEDYKITERNYIVEGWMF